MSGTPVFAGTRVPVQNLFDYIEGGETLDEFLASFPDVTREHAIAVIGLAKSLVLQRFTPQSAAPNPFGVMSFADALAEPEGLLDFEFEPPRVILSFRAAELGAD
jgi:uncharacterized protein (DUF433 family)